MKRWHKILLTVLVVVLGILLIRAIASPEEEEHAYVFTDVVQTDLQATVSSTGTLSTVETVEVGTQVSGQVTQVFADYNDQVEKGQLLALIDTETLDAALADARARVVQAEAQQAQAEAQVAEAEANLADARATLTRNEPLFKNGYLSQSEFQPIQTAVQTAEASVRRTQAALRSAEAQVAQANAQVAQTQKDRRNAEIRAPISGIVIERNVDAGQTVAASFETPTLFILAENMQKMQILADVDESDIGQIQKGGAVTFTVPAYPDETYEGVVREVRLQPNTSQNVVTYTVVIDVINTDGKLLPGMTTTVEFVTGKANNVLAVSTAALQLQVTPQMQQALMHTAPPGAPGEAQAMPRPDSTGGMPPVPGGFQMPNGPGANTSMLWYLDAQEQLHAVPVKTGLSSGALTEIEPVGPAAAVVQPGLHVIEQRLTENSNPFAGGPGRGPGGPPM